MTHTLKPASPRPGSSTCAETQTQPTAVPGRARLHSVLALAALGALALGQAAHAQVARGAPRIDAEAGQCFAKVITPARYETRTEEVVERAATRLVDVTPATFRTEQQQVEIRPATTRTIVEPAVYETRSKRVLVRPEQKVWRPGRGALERIDHMTGEIMCLVTIPAEYRTITERVLVTPEKVRTEQVPPEFTTVEVRVEDTPASERLQDVPEVKRTVQRRVLVQPATIEWKPILCETNANADLVRNLQVALRDRGHNPGPIDGIIGQQTRAALERFQTAANLPVGALNDPTLQALGVRR